MIKFLDVANNYDNAGLWIRNTLYYVPMPFEKCTSEQQILFKDRLEQVITNMEALEKPWKEAGKPMNQQSYVEELRDYLNFLRMSGTAISITGNTVDGEPFDIMQYRGRVVTLHFLGDVVWSLYSANSADEGTLCKVPRPEF